MILSNIMSAVVIACWVGALVYLTSPGQEMEDWAQRAIQKAEEQRLKPT